MHECKKRTKTLYHQAHSIKGHSKAFCMNELLDPKISWIIDERYQASQKKWFIVLYSNEILKNINRGDSVQGYRLYSKNIDSTEKRKKRKKIVPIKNLSRFQEFSK